MSLFSEYAVTPDVYNESCYGSPTLCDVHVRQLQKVFLSEGIVRDLRNSESIVRDSCNSEWRKFFSTPMVPWHPHVRRLLKNLTTEGRLVPSAPALRYTPKNDREWCKEALASHKNLPLNGIIVSSDTKNFYRKNSLVESVEKLSSSTKCTWWSPEDGSIRLKRNIDDYKDALKLILRHAKSIMFIDPYIRPEKREYADFIQLLKAASNRPSKSPQLPVEIHTKIHNIPGKSWEESLRIMKDTFQSKFAVPSQSHLKVEVFIWDDFHDRYLISNLGGIQVPYGFGTSTASDLTTWSRLGRSARDNVQLEFDRESGQHKLHSDFMIL